MPWSNQSGGGSGGGGPWGGGGGNSGGQGPWGSGGGGNQPDIEEMLRKGQDRLKSIIPGGGNNKLVGMVIVLVAVTAWLANGFYKVQPDEEGVELVFGKVVETTAPGLHYNFPAPIGSVERPKVTRSNRVDVGYRGSFETNSRGNVRDVTEESMMLTGDENIVDMDFAVLWRIKDAKSYLFNIRDPEGTVKAAAESAMREVVGQTKFDDAVTIGRERIEQRTRELLQNILDSYSAGIEVETVNLQKSDPPPEVIDSFNDVQRARQDRDRLQKKAEAYANSIVPEARGLAEKDIKEAEAYREKQIQEARGEADRFNSVYDAYKTAPEVTKQRMYLETLGAVMGEARKVIIDQKGGGSGVVPYLPLPEVQKRQQQSSQPK